jgi:hypothetical protein
MVRKRRTRCNNVAEWWDAQRTCTAVHSAGTHGSMLLYPLLSHGMLLSCHDNPASPPSYSAPPALR